MLITLVLAASLFSYPQTKTVDQTDTYPGNVVVADPYRWLENDVRESPDVAQWVAAQNKVTFDYLEKLPYRDAIRKRITELADYAKYSVPRKSGDRYFYKLNTGLQNQAVLYVTSAPGQSARVLIDPNTWTKDGTVALTEYVPSDDGRLLAYGVAEAGSDWQTWWVMDVDSGKQLSDELRFIKFTQPSWTKDGKGFFYGRYPEPQKGTAFQGLNKQQKLFYHRVGTPQSADAVVYWEPDHPEWTHHGQVTDDGRYLVITTTKSSADVNRLLVKDLTEPYAMPQTLVNSFENEYELAGSNGSTLYFKTDLDAPRRRLIAVDVDNPDRANWKEIIPQAGDLLADVSHIGGHFVAQYLKDARAAVQILSTDGKPTRSVSLGAIGTASGFDGKPSDSETFYEFQTFTVAPTIYRYDVRTGESKPVFQSNTKINPIDYDVKQVFYTSKDGTRVPMFITHRKGLRLDGTNPTLLYGYGGFNIAMKPGFSVSRLAWLEMGGVFAVANLRGGSEYGEEWHKAGSRLLKQNTFDDFIAAAEWLIKNRYTRPEKLAIQGGSNGGLLVGAAMTQRPELFGVALPAVGVMDMLRFQRFTAGRFWTEDYGSSDNPEEFRVLHSYSPLHNLKKGTRYPATLVTTADTDDRVVPGHSFKFAAALQAAHEGPEPVLIRVETRAGHGAGKPITKTIEEAADTYAFVAANLGMKVGKPSIKNQKPATEH